MDEKESLLNNFKSELKRGVLVLCVLAASKEPAYGYQLIRHLGEAGIEAEGNTLYPLLRRLEEQGLLKSEWDTSGEKPRKYYQETEFGKAILRDLKAQWFLTIESVNGLLGEGTDGQ